MMSRRKHGIFISAPHDGQVYVAERSRRGTPSSCTCSRRPTARVLHNLIQLSPHKEAARVDGFAERNLWNICPVDRLLRLDVGGTDHLGPFFSFDNYELTKFDGRHRHWLAAEFSETCF